MACDAGRMTLPSTMVIAVYNAAGTTPGPSTTTPGGVITITGGPNATANIPGAHNDPADLYGIVLGLAAILVAIGLTRLIFRTRGGSGRRSTGPGEPPPPGPAQEGPGRN